MYKNKAFAKLTNATCPLLVSFFNTTMRWATLSEHVETLFYSAESLQQCLPFGEQSFFLFGGVHVQWGPDGGRARARDVWTHCGRACSSGRTRFFQWNLMGDP